MGRATPPAQRQRLVALWHGSPLTKAAFARSQGLHPGTFRAWVARYDATPAVASSSCTFVQVVAPPVVAVSTTFAVHVEEHALRFEAPPPPAWFAALLRELAGC